MTRNAKTAAQTQNDPSKGRRPAGDTHGKGPTFPELLAELHTAGFTGRIEASCAPERIRIYLRDGQPVFVELGRYRHSLGQLLLRTERITRAQYEEAVTVVTNQLVDDEEIRMGECLVKLGVLTTAEVYEALKRQVEEKILDCFRWKSVAYRADAGAEHLADVTPIECRPVPYLIYAGLRRHISRGSLERLLSPVQGAYPVLNGEFTAVAQT